ncbi:MAG TPA: hypothetical protein VFA67_16480 [Candidatus Sulfotelmatobacter sp.]|nr:hypothetical protein [Candidatus Sulfotelmatobacter sp.]
MAFCGNCGAALVQQSGFCGSCGKPVGAGPQAIAAPPVHAAAAPGAPSVSLGSDASGLTSNLAGALAYALGLITGILFLVLDPYKRDRFVRFHAMQSVIFSMACIAFSIAWRILVAVLSSINPWIALATMPVRLLISLGFFCLWLYVIFQAYNQREYRIPFIGGIAARQAGS